MNYKIDSEKLEKVWLVLSKDNFVCTENLYQILKIAKQNNISQDSIHYITSSKFDTMEFLDEAATVSFFGDKMIVIKDFDFDSLSQTQIDAIISSINVNLGTHLAIILTYEDEKALKSKKAAQLIDFCKENGNVSILAALDEQFFIDVIKDKAKKLSVKIDKETAKYIVNSIGKNASLIVNEVEKYAAACNYTQIEKNIVDAVGVKTLEARIFDVIDYICDKKAVKALQTINMLYSQGTDEIAILATLSTAFIDIHRCILAKKNGISYQTVHSDFEKKSNAYRYKKAMMNSNKFSEKDVEDILKIMLKTDIRLKSTNIEKKYLIDLLVVQIIARGKAIK